MVADVPWTLVPQCSGPIPSRAPLSAVNGGRPAYAPVHPGVQRPPGRENAEARSGPCRDAGHVPWSGTYAARAGAEAACGHRPLKTAKAQLETQPIAPKSERHVRCAVPKTAGITADKRRR